MVVSEKIKKKFNSRYVVDSVTGCHIWPSTRRYGSFWFSTGPKTSVTFSAHRFSWMINSGPIQAGLQVLHKCDNGRCVNTEHLFLGTQQDNIDDMMAKKRHKPPRGESNASAKLCTKDIEDIITLLCAGVKAREIAAIYNVTRDTIKRISGKTTWKHITRSPEFSKRLDARYN